MGDFMFRHYTELRSHFNNKFARFPKLHTRLPHLMMPSLARGILISLNSAEFYKFNTYLW
jgi:hypothetical protein